MVKDKKVTESLFLVILVSLSLIFFVPFFLNPHLLTIKDNDLGRTYIPLFTFIRESFYSYKSLPLWRPDQLMGEPFIGNPLSSLLYPANILFLIFPVNFASVFFYFCHFSLAAIFTYFLARSFNFSKPSSFAAAIFYTFSTKMLLHTSAGHITMIAAFSYFPLVFLSLRKVLISPIFSWIVIGSMSLTLMYVLYPTIFYYSAIFVIIYWFYRLLADWWQNKTFEPQKTKKQFLHLILMALVTFGLSAIVLFPQAEFGSLSTRSSLRLEDVAQPLWNLKRFLISLFFPYMDFANLDHESFLYLGIVPSLLFLTGFLRLPTIKKVFLISAGVITLLFVAGLSTPIFKLAYDFIPFLKYSRITTRLWFIVVLIVALIAAYGLEKIKRKSLIYLVLIVSLIESFFIGYRKIITVPNLSFKNEALYQYLDSNQDIFRVYCTSYCFNPQLISKYKIQTLHGETPIQGADFIEFLARAGNYQFDKFAVIFPPYQVWQKANPPQPNAYLLGLTNVKYVASTYEIKGENLLFLDKFQEIYLYLNKKYRPRVYFENSNEQVKIKKYSPNQIVIEFAKAPVVQTLIFSENFYPGWFAYGANQKFKVEKQEQIFRKVIVPAGTSVLELKYQPESLTFGKTITIATVIALILWYIHKRQPITR